MKTKSLFISAQEINAGMLFVSMGMMEILKRNLHRVAFFRPIIYKRSVRDEDIHFMLSRYKLEMEYEDAFGFDVEEVEHMIASNKLGELINQLIQKFKKLESKYDFVLCEGIRRSFLNANIHFDLNMKIAQNFGLPYINIINAKERSVQEIYENVMIENENFLSLGGSHFATFINRLDILKHEEMQQLLLGYEPKTYLLKEVQELSLLSIQDVLDSLGATEVLISKEQKLRSIRKVRVAALTLDNFLNHIEEDDLVIVPADRSDIILGLLGALYSKNYPNISAIIFPFDMRAHPNINKLIAGLEQFNIPIMAVPTDTYETAKNLSQVHSRIRVNSQRKIALSLGLFNATVDTAYIEQKIASASSDVMTPMMFEYKIFELARVNVFLY